MNSVLFTTDTPNSAIDALVFSAEVAAAQLDLGVDDSTHEALVNEFIRLNDQIAKAPVSSLFEVRLKAQHLLSAWEVIGDPLDVDVLRHLLQSLAQEPVA